MNDRINYSCFVDLNFNSREEPDPDLREWPVVQSDVPAAIGRETPSLNKAATEE